MNPIKDRQPISRFSFRGRPVCSPGTVLVYQLPNGDLVSPVNPFTYGELLLRKPQEYFVVDVSKHTDSFSDTLPSKALTLEFTFTASYEWRVGDAAVVVRENVDDADELCRRRLRDELPSITRGFEPLQVMEGEDHLNAMFRGMTLELEEGIRMTVSRIGLKLPKEHREAATALDVNPLKDRVQESAQETELKQHKKKVEAYLEIMEQGDDAAIANFLASDPESAREVASMTVDNSNKRRAAIVEMARIFADNEMIPVGQVSKLIESATEALSETLAPQGASKRSVAPAIERRALNAGDGSEIEGSDAEEDED